jgi:hypothetical protein
VPRISCSYILFRHKTNCLVGISGDREPDSLTTIAINIIPTSLLAKSLLTKQILHSFDIENTARLPLSIVKYADCWVQKNALIPLWQRTLSASFQIVNQKSRRLI